MIKKLAECALSVLMTVVFITAAVQLPAFAEQEITRTAVIKLGDYLKMGTYYGEPILWRCVAFEKITGYDDNGNPVVDSTDTSGEYKEGYLPLMLSDEIICIKPYDAELSENSTTGSHSIRDKYMYGSNCWADSNMRSWLNSDAKMGEIEWLCGNPPSTDTVMSGYNAYDNEAGFLTNFRPEALSAIKKATQKSILGYPEWSSGNYTSGTEFFQYDSSSEEGYVYNTKIDEAVQNYTAAYSEQVTDRMFLLDVRQVNEVYNNRTVLGEDYYIAGPTEQAVENSDYTSTSLDAGKKYYYWLRTPCAYARYASHYVRCVYGWGEVLDNKAYRGDAGVRPAFYLNTEALDEAEGDGTEAAPYIIGDLTSPPAPEPEQPEPEPEPLPIKLGDYMKMGYYYGEPIVWRCVSFEKIKGYDDNGNPMIDSTDTVREYQEGYLPLMLSENIISLKEFDGKGINTKSSSHGLNSSRTFMGSNYWPDSNMRSWLNSEETAGNVTWLCGNPPETYKDEAGFLTAFTQDELSAVKPVTQKSIVSYVEQKNNKYTEGSGLLTYNQSYCTIDDSINGYTKAYAEQITDRMFLPDVMQMYTVSKNKDFFEDDDQYIGEPTEKAIENSDYSSSDLAAGKKWMTLLRTPSAGGFESMRCITRYGIVLKTSAVNKGSGVRPAFYLDPFTDKAEGSGTVFSPWVIDPDKAVVPHPGREDDIIRLGDYIEMGTYYGRPIVWRCVSFEKVTGYDDNGNPIIDSTDTVREYRDGYLPLMLADKMICIKPFDAQTSRNRRTGSHRRNTESARFGSSYWADSNIRCWLNSEASAGNVEWVCGNPPIADKVSGGYNAYNNEAGFLTNFSGNELKLIKEVTQKIIVSEYEVNSGLYTDGSEVYMWTADFKKKVYDNYEKAYSEQATDKMFLPDTRQMKTVYNNTDVLGDDYYIGKMTPEAEANSDYLMDGMKAGEKWYCWLRSANGGSVERVYPLGGVSGTSAQQSDTGVRPSFFLDLSMIAEKSGNGTETEPYVISELNEGIIYGDAGGNGEIAADDAAYLLQKTLTSTYRIPIEDKTDNWMKYADVSADGEIAADDAAYVLQKVLVSTYIMPVEKNE